MKKIYYYCYVTINKITGKMYVGEHSTTNLNDKYLGSGKALKDSFKKYRKKNFLRVILKFYKNKNNAHIDQERYIDMFDTLTPNGYNISPSGGTNISGRHSPETIEILRKLSTKYLDPIQHKREWRKKYRESPKGKLVQQKSDEKRSKNPKRMMYKKIQWSTEDAIQKRAIRARRSYLKNREKILNKQKERKQQKKEV